MWLLQALGVFSLIVFAAVSCDSPLTPTKSNPKDAEVTAIVEERRRKELETCLAKSADIVALAKKKITQKDYDGASNVLNDCIDDGRKDEIRTVYREARLLGATDRLTKIKNSDDRLALLKDIQFFSETFNPKIDKEIEGLQKRLDAKETAAVKTKKRKEGVVIGMSKQDVLDSSWGKPQRVNRDIYPNNRVKEQWAYSGGYLYFENDVLTSISTRQ